MNIAFDLPFYLLVGIFVVLVLAGSFYSSIVFRRTIQYLDSRYPREEYPGLISVSPNLLTRLSYLDILVGIAGLVAIFASVLFWYPGIENIVIQNLLHPYLVISCYLGYLALRVLAWIPLGVIGAKRLSNMKAPTRRSATLQGTKITDYIPLALVVFSIVIYLTAFTLNAWWFMSGEGPRFMIGIFSLLSAFSLIKRLRQTFKGPQFKRIDPFVTHDDLFEQRRQSLRLQFGGAVIWIPLLLIAAEQTGILGFDPGLSFSLIVLCLVFTVQTLHMSWSVKRWVKETDISVYRVPSNPAESDD